MWTRLGEFLEDLGKDTLEGSVGRSLAISLDSGEGTGLGWRRVAFFAARHGQAAENAVDPR